MTLFLVKCTLASAIALGGVALARHARASLRHAMLRALFVLLALLPLTATMLPKIVIPVSEPVAAAVSLGATQTAPQAAVADVTTHSKVEVAQTTPITLRSLFLPIYLAVSALLLMMLGAGIWRLRRWADHGEIWLDGIRLAAEIAHANGIRRTVFVVTSPDVRVPMTFGFRRQTIVLPQDAKTWNDDELRQALRHELEHLRRDDWAFQIIARAVTALYWFHPLVWVAMRRFCVEAERACDDAVIESFRPSSYASQLVEMARSLSGPPRVPALAMAAPTRLGERVRAILDPSQARGRISGFAATTTVAIMLAVLVTFGSTQLVAAVAAGHDDGVRGGVAGGVEGGVEGGIEGGVEGSQDDEEEEESYSEVVIKAAKKGNIKLLGKLLDDGLDVNRTYNGDGTPLLVASRAGRMETVKFLLSRGADVNVPSPGDGNPLIAAAQDGQLEIVRLLLDRGARIDELVPGDENALMGASEGGKIDVVRLLISRGANVNLGVWVERGEDGKREFRTPLERARHGGHADVERVLIEAGARQ